MRFDYLIAPSVFCVGCTVHPDSISIEFMQIEEGATFEIGDRLILESDDESQFTVIIPSTLDAELISIELTRA